MTRRKRKIGFLKTLLTTTALFACPAVQADEISIVIDSSGKTATLTTGGTLAQDHTEELKNVILLNVAPTEKIEIKNGVLAVSKTLNINSGTFGIASTSYDKATFEAVNGTLNINGGNFNSSAYVNFTLAGKTVNVLNNAVFSSSVSESGSGHPIYRIKGDNISFAGTAKSGRLQLYFIPYKDGGKWNISAPIEEYSVIFGEEESSGYVNPASMVEVSETIAATGMFKESPGSVKVNRGITVHFSKDVSSAHFFQNRGVVRLDGTLTTGFYGGFKDSALYGTGSIVMNVPDDGKSANRALHNIGYNPTTGKTERFKSIVVKSKKNNSYGNHDITGQSSIETVTVIDSGINLMGRGSLIDIGTLTVNGYYDYSHSFGLFQVTDGAIANIGMLTVNETEAHVKIDSTLIVDKYKLPPKGSSTGGIFGVFLLQDGATFLRRNGGVLELDDFYQNGDVNIGGASTTTPATFGAGDWSKVYATGYVDLKGDGQNASKFYGIKGLSSDVASLVNAETGLNFIISSGAVEVKNIYGETGGKGVVKSGATLTADSVSLSINTSKIIAPTIQIDQDGRLNLQSSIEASGGKNYVVFKGKGTLSVPKNIAEKLTETALYAFLDNLGTLEIDTSTGDNTVVLYDNRDNQDISSSIDKLVFKGDNAGTLQLCDKLIVRGADFGTNGKVHLITGSTLYFDVNGTLPANIIGTGTLGLLNSSKLELSDAAVGNLTLEGLEIDGKAEAVIKADISIDKLKFMQDTGGTLGIDSGKTLTVKSGVTMGTGNKIDGANGALIVQGDSSFSNTVLGTLTAQKATFKGGNSTIGTYNAQGNVVVEAGTTLAVVNAFDLSGGYPVSGGYHVSGDGSLTVGKGGKIATGDKVLANLTINGATTFYDDSTIGTLKVTDGVTAKVATDKTLTISKSFSGAINAGEATLRLIDSAQADFKAGDSTKMARFVMEGADARAAFYGNYSLNEMELKQGTIVLADGAVLSLSHGILSGGNITGVGTLNLTAQNTEITETGNYALSHLTFGNGGALTLNGTLTVLNNTNVKDSLSGSGTLNFGANGTIGGGKFDGTISVGKNQVTVESNMELGTFKFTQSAGGTLWINNNVTLTVGKLQGVGSNTVHGGILKLLSGGEIGKVNITGELSLGGDTTITGDSVIDTVTATGDIIIADGVTLTVNKKLDLSPNNNIVYGAQNTGTLVLNGSDNKIATKTKILGTLRIGESGAVTFYDNAVIGTLDSRGTTTVAAGKTLTIRQSYGGKLSASGATLKLTETAQGTFAAGDGSVIGRLEIAGDGAKATFNGAYALNDLTLSKGQVEINDVLTLKQGTFTGGTVSGTGSLKLAGTLTIGAGAGVSISNLAFDTDGKLNLNGTLTVLNNTNVKDSLSGSGTLNFGANGTIGGGKFDGTISVGKNQVTVESNMELGTFKFTQSAGGTLWINNNVTLTVGKLQGVGSNTVHGGILKLLSGGEIGKVNITGELSLGGDTTITGDSVIDTVTATGDIIIADGVTLTVNKKLDLSPNNNIVYGAQNTGTLVLNGSDNKIATKTKILGTLRIGESGAVTFYDNAVIGTLDSRGTTTVAAGKTLTIRQSYGGKLSASGATLKLTETAQGTFAAGDGSVIGRLEIAGDGAKATFNGAYALNDLTLSKGQVEINDVLTLKQGTFTGGTVSGTGSLKLAGTLTIGAGAGVSISNLAFDTDGKLNLNGQLTVNNELDYRGHLVDAGNGTLTLGAKGTFGGTFNGTVRVGQTTAEIKADSVFKAFEFTATGGALTIADGVTLTIADGATLTIAQLNAAGNSVSGGNLKLTGGAVFDTARLNNLTAGADVVVNKSLTVNGDLSAASVSGVGELTLTNGGSLTTGGKVLGTLSGGQATITGDSTVGALNADVIINAGKTLTITKSVKDGLAASGDGLLLLDGASAAFGSAAIKNLKLNNASVVWSGVLTVDSLQSGDAPSTLTGGTLALAGNAAFNGKMDVDALNVNEGTFTFNGTTGDVKKMTLVDGAKLVIATGELNAYGFAGENNTVTIAEDAAFGLDLGSSQALPTGLTITGAGYLSLLNETSLTFAGNAGEFGELGGLQVMRGTVTITADTNVKNFRFGDKTGGTLNIENGTFSVSKITTRSDNNKIIGKGTLKLTAGESVFDSALDGETKIVVGGKALALFNGKTVLPALTVENGGGVGAGENGDVSIAELSMKNGKIFGSGVLKADKLTMDGGTVKVSGGLAAKTIENGTLEVEENGVLSLENSVLNSAGITMTDGLLNLKTDYALSALNLTLNGGTVSFGTLTVDAAFVNAGGKLSGTKLIWAHDGKLTAQADVDTLQINAGLVLTNDTTVNTLDFGGSGALTLSGGLTVNGSLNLTRDIAGNGTLIAAGDAVLGANFGGTLQIGTDAKAGTATVVSDATFGGLTFGGKGGAVEINAGKRLSVPTVSVASGGTVAGDGTLALTGTGSVLGANLSVAEIELSGQATAQTASVNGLTLKDGGRVDVENGLSVAKLKQTGTNGVINGGTLTVQSAAVENSLTLNNAAATIGSLSGAGVLRLNGSDTVLSQANIGTLAVSGGTLNIGKNQITANAFTMENGTLKLQIGKNATDGNGNATGVGHGKITGGTTVSNSALSIEVEYNTYIPKNGVVFKLFDGSQNGAFAEVANEKYKITAESNGNYRIAKLHTSAENAGNAGGNKNQQNTAEGLLDHPPFDEGDKTYDLADELNRLEQSDKQSFLDGLTAAAPDVSGAVSAAHLRSQRVINSMTVKRLTALHDKLGRSSYGFRRDQKLMRGMRRGRSGGSRYYDARKYYQKAYGRGAARSSVRSKPYENYWSNGLAEYQNWRTPTASVWVETLLNKTTYKDDGKPDGFSGTSTGFTVGLDTVMMDIAAAGVGYAHTTTDITALNRKTTFTSNTLFVYGTFKPNETYLSAIVNFGAGSYDEDKTVGTLKLSDAYDAKQYGVQITAGGNFDVYNPSVGLRYSAANLDAREDSAGQKVAAQSFKTLTLSVDNRWELPLKQTKWTKTGMNLNVGTAYDISRSADKAEVALSNGASYTVEGAKPDALTFNAGAEVYWIFGRKISLSAKYDADIASSYLSHSVSANLSFQF